MDDALFETRSEVLKLDDSLGLVFGWGAIFSEAGEEYFDTQGDAIQDQAMIEASTDFMLKSRRTSGDMHEAADGDVVFLLPLTDEVAKVFGISCEKRGVMLAMKPSPEVYAKFKSGEYTGFSIGGERVLEEVVEP